MLLFFRNEDKYGVLVPREGAAGAPASANGMTRKWRRKALKSLKMDSLICGFGVSSC